MEGLVTAGAFVALADGRIEEVERDELLDFIDRRQLAPTILREQRSPKYSTGACDNSRTETARR